MPLEFRVRWEREGRRPKTAIYQSWDTALQKLRSVKALDAVKAEFPRIAETPDLVSAELQVREVGAWRAHDYQPEVDEGSVERFRDHMRWTEPSVTPEPEGSGPFGF